MIALKQIGDARVEFGGSEKPQYEALNDSIQGFYRDLIRPLKALEKEAFMLLGLPEVKAEAFRYSSLKKATIDAALDLFLSEIAGEDRSREGYVESETNDGVLQQWQRFSFAVGLRRGSDLTDRPQTLSAERNSPATRAMLDNAFQRLSEGGKLRLEKVRDEVHSVLTSATQAGLGPLDTGRQLSSLFTNYNRVQFDRLARTEAAFASIEGSRLQMEELGVRFVRWLFSAGTCPICLSFDGLLIPVDDTERHPPGHPNCCVGGTLVWGPQVLASTTRWYAGQVVDLVTVSGYNLTVTPNHPILTPKGWVAAGLLNEGSQVVCGSGQQRVSSRIHPDEYQIPALIEEVAATLGTAGLVSSRTVETTDVDFHGDGLGSEVCVVRTNGLLGYRLNPSLLQPFSEELLCRRHAETLALARESADAQLFVGALRPSDSGVRGFGHQAALLGSPSSRQPGLNAAARMERHVSTFEHPEHRPAAATNSPSNSELVLAGEIKTDNLIRVKPRFFEGHVYNLQTEGEWYTASNFITHNCLCDISPA